MEENEKVEIEEYIEKGEVLIRWANGIVIYCTPEGKKVLDNMGFNTPQ